MSLLTKLARKALTNAIKKDKMLRYGYQSNIAMSFYDAYISNVKDYKNRKDVAEIANKAADNFLNNWCN